MTPFRNFPLVTGIKDKVEAILAIDDKVYVALTGGTIQTYQTEGLQDGMFGHYRRGYVKLILFGVDGPVGTSQPRARLISTRKGLARKPIDQLEYLEDLDALAILSDQTVTLYDLPNLKTPTILSQARYVQSIAVRTIWVPPKHLARTDKKLSTARSSKAENRSDVNANLPQEEASLEEDLIRVSILVIGARKKVHVLTYVSGKPYSNREIALAHTPRLIIFPTGKKAWSTDVTSTKRRPTIHLHYNTNEWGILEVDLFSKEKGTSAGLRVLESPVASGGADVSNANLGMTSTANSGQSEKPSGGLGVGGAFGGLGGYVGKGFRAVSGATAAGNSIVGVGIGSDYPMEEVEDANAVSLEDASLVIKGDQGVFYDETGRTINATPIDFSADTVPEDLAFADPYILSVLPAASQTVPSKLEIRLKQTLTVQQIVDVGSGPIDPDSPVAATIGAGHVSSASVRCLTVGVEGKDGTNQASPLSRPASAFYLSTPADKLQLQTDGATIWCMRGETWVQILDDATVNGRFEDGRGLLQGIKGRPGLTVEVSKYDAQFRKLGAVAAFSKENWEPAVEEFIKLNITPAKVISLYPADTVSGPLHVPQENWIQAFGGPADGKLSPAHKMTDESKKEKTQGPVGMLKGIAHLGSTKKDSSSTRSRDTASSKGKDVDSASTIGDDGTINESNKDTIVEYEVCPPAALEALIHYLSDRRQKLVGAMSSIPGGPPSIDSLSPFKMIPRSELRNYPDIPFTELSPEQIVRVAQIVYTALLKVYLAIRPVLVGSLCRIENWCEVEEVEELLMSKQRYSDLIDLYQGKRMHDKALSLLRELAKDEEDKLDKLDPTIRYLQKLGPDYLDLILDESKWVFGEDPAFALRIFTADEAEVEALPRHRVLAHLEKMGPTACVGYLEHITEELGEAGPDYHDKLAELYLDQARKTPGDPAQGESRLLSFLQKSTQYRPERILGRMRSEEFPRIRAVLLGKLGNHDGALQIYVHRLHSCGEAEDYCSRVWQEAPDPRGIFLSLLRIYLQPSGSLAPLIDPALALIATHGTRIDASATIDLLPPLVTMKDVHKYFLRTLRDRHSKSSQAKITRALLIARRDQVDQTLTSCQEKRVRITDMRICPQCQKRIGQSAIAVHAPRGEVTHYNCKDVYSRMLVAHRTL